MIVEFVFEFGKYLGNSQQLYFYNGLNIINVIKIVSIKMIRNKDRVQWFRVFIDFLKGGNLIYSTYVR